MSSFNFPLPHSPLFICVNPQPARHSPAAAGRRLVHLRPVAPEAWRRRIPFVVRCLSRRRTSASSVESLCVGGSIRVHFRVCFAVDFSWASFFSFFVPFRAIPKSSSASICGLSRRRLGEGGFVCCSLPVAP